MFIQTWSGIVQGSIYLYGIDQGAVFWYIHADFQPMTQPSFTRAVGRNTIIQFVGKVGGTTLGLVTVAMLQRYLEPVGFGAYVTATVYLGFFSVIADLGLYVLLVRELAKPGADANRVTGNLLGLRWVSAAIILALGIGLVFVFPYPAEIRQAVLAGVLAHVAIAANQLLIAVFQNRLAMRWVVLGEFVSRGVWLAGTWAAISLGLGLSAFMAVIVLANMLFLLTLWLAARRYISLRPRFDFTYWKYLLKETWPIAISVVLNLIYFRADTLILAWLKPVYEVGLYGAAYKVLEILNTFPLMFVGLLLPALGAAYASQDRERFIRLYQRGFELLTIAALPLVVGGWILAEPVLVLIGDSEYAPAAPILRLLLIAVAALFMNSLSGHVVTVIGRQRQMVWTYLGVAVLGLVAYLTLIPVYGPRGAAIGTILTQSSTAIVGSWMVFRTVRFRLTWLVVSKTVVASAVLGVTVWALRDAPLFLPILVGGAVYVAILLGTKAIPFSQLKEIFTPRVTSTIEPPLP